ncbi:MAG: asparagine synthase (glutamine-hydrolyzing) [Candidatus Kapabacteria bacterium]|nr:asparagine synthase (glutamine-hydrolyzing) [Candidatus Kapabacteria bacterium]
MCGIVALVDRRASYADLTETGAAMLAVMSHRGPDNRGTWQQGPVLLGHNRLSILDLSAASHQPMVVDDAILTFNGEIYNYVELRTELERDGFRFTTTGDTEVILAAYRRWGSSCVEHFIGMWAFALWDERSQTLFCSRDRFGIKPFFYAFRDERLAIASEIKAIKCSPLFRGGLNEQQVARGLYLGWMQQGTETYFNDVTILPAAHNMEWHDGRLRTWQYATLPTDAESHGSFDESVATFRELFLDSIRISSRRDVPMGICLSGGLDSTSIAGALASTGAEMEVRTFTAYYTGNQRTDVDERPYINHLLERYPAIQPSWCSPSDADVAESLQRIIWLMDAPLPSSSYISQYFVMKLAAEGGVKVVLDGQGSDEMLGGYLHSLYRIVADFVRRGNVSGALAELNAHALRQGLTAGQRLASAGKSLLTSLRDEPSLYRLELSRTAPWVLAMPSDDVAINLAMPRGSRFNAFLANLIHTTLLPTLLHTEDLNAMAFGIESRVPFLDHRLVEACFRMPSAHRFHRGETKRVLRAAMRGIVPDAILDRKDKTGFITPGHTRWLRGELRYLLDGSWKELDGLVRPEAVRSVVERYRKGDNSNALFVWRLAMVRAFLAA